MFIDIWCCILISLNISINTFSRVKCCVSLSLLKCNCWMRTHLSRNHRIHLRGTREVSHESTPLYSTQNPWKISRAFLLNYRLQKKTGSNTQNTVRAPAMIIQVVGKDSIVELGLIDGTSWCETMVPVLFRNGNNSKQASCQLGFHVHPLEMSMKYVIVVYCRFVQKTFWSSKDLDDHSACRAHVWPLDTWVVFWEYSQSLKITHHKYPQTRSGWLV